MLAHCFGNNLVGLNNVVEDDRLPFKLLVSAETLGINELHLLEHSRFSRLSSTCLTRMACQSRYTISRRVMTNPTQQEELDLLR